MTSFNPTIPGFPLEFLPQAGQDSELLSNLGFLPGLQEVLMVRQVHALEHATVWVLSESAGINSARENTPDSGLLSGMSTERGFYLYGSVNTADLHRAVHRALDRLVRGEWDLAVHPRCGTNVSVGMLLTAGLAMGINLFLPKDPLGQLLGIGAAAMAATALAPDMGSLAQRYVTTAIPFNLRVEEITPGRDRSGQLYHFVRITWVDA